MARLEGPRALVDEACAWVARNPETWERLRSMCSALAFRGEPVSRDTVYTLAMQAGMGVGEARAFRRDHNLWSVLSRYMALMDPGMLRSCRYRRTPVDEVDLVEAWERNVGPAEFAASSLAEARAIWGGAAA